MIAYNLVRASLNSASLVRTPAVDVQDRREAMYECWVARVIIDGRVDHDPAIWLQIKKRLTCAMCQMAIEQWSSEFFRMNDFENKGE